MTQRRLFTSGLVLLAAALFAVRMWLVNGPGEVAGKQGPWADRRSERILELQANTEGWVHVGHGPLLIQAEGTISIGERQAVPDDNGRRYVDALVPELPGGMLVGKIGNDGRPFKIGRLSQIASKEAVFVAINDSDYSDNKGHYILRLSHELIR